MLFGVAHTRGLGKHGVVLELRLPQRGGVASNDDELGLASAEALEGRLVSEGDLTGLHNKRKARVDGVGGSLVLLGGHLCAQECVSGSSCGCCCAPVEFVKKFVIVARNLVWISRRQDLLVLVSDPLTHVNCPAVCDDYNVLSERFINIYIDCESYINQLSSIYGQPKIFRRLFRGIMHAVPHPMSSSTPSRESCHYLISLLVYAAAR